MLEEEQVTNRFNHFSLRVSKTGTDADLYPAFSFSSVRLVSSWMTVISSCSRSNHCFRKKNPTAAPYCLSYERVHECSNALCISCSYFYRHFLFRQKQKFINGQRFGGRFPLHPLFHPCWTILVGRISLAG